MRWQFVEGNEDYGSGRAVDRSIMHSPLVWLIVGVIGISFCCFPSGGECIFTEFGFWSSHRARQVAIVSDWLARADIALRADVRSGSKAEIKGRLVDIRSDSKAEVDLRKMSPPGTVFLTFTLVTNHSKVDSADQIRTERLRGVHCTHSLSQSAGIRPHRHESA
jgi:hypothetical protein